MSLPTGTVTFLFTDIEGSTRLIQLLGERYPMVQAEHHRLLRQALGRTGNELRTEGDSFFYVFGSAVDACCAAAAAQRALTEHEWPEGATVRVRMGLHTGEAALLGNEYIGLDVHRAARIASAANGGQVLISETTRPIVEHALPAELSLKDLGLHRLKDLARPERLHQLVISGLRTEFPALRTVDTTPNNLPTQLTSFVGREAELAEGRRLLRGTRLLTLTGPGGTGKTRLSLQIAADAVDQFKDGVYFVPLSALRDPQIVPAVIAQVIGLPVGSRPAEEVIAEHLKERKVLLVLDNFEQLLPAAPLISDLLHKAPDLKVIVSSRAVLRVYGEQEFPVPPLRLPDAKSAISLEALSQYEAVRLFIERAVAVRPDFQVTNENAPAVAGICERVDGLPLAIELAAARVKLFSPEALLKRLEKSISVLGGGARDLPGRQQTLRGAIAWSYDLLDETGRRLLCRFSVFGRGAHLTQAEAVCDPDGRLGVDVLDGLDQLADQSLLRRLPDFDEPRFLMLQVIREFAADRLRESGDEPAVRDRHVAAYLALAQQAESSYFGSRRKECLDRLELEQDNFRAALDWCVERGDAERAMRIAAALWRFWQMRGHLAEGRAHFEQVLAIPQAAAQEDARRLALEGAGGIAYWQADMEVAQAFYDECLELTRKHGDKRALANALYNDAFPRLVVAYSTSVASSLALLQEALPLFKEVGDDAGAARVLWALGNATYFTGDLEKAIEYLREAEKVFRPLDDRFGLGWVLHTLTLAYTILGRLEDARRTGREGLELFAGVHDVTGIVLMLDDFADLARKEGDLDRAARLSGAAAAHERSSGASLAQTVTQQTGRSGRAGLNEGATARAWQEGSEMSLEAAIEYAQQALKSAHP